jgi:hypothetical protein
MVGNGYPRYAVRGVKDYNHVVGVGGKQTKADRELAMKEQIRVELFAIRPGLGINGKQSSNNVRACFR